MSDLDNYEDIVIDEAFARSKGCAMPELVNLLDDQEVLLHLKVRSASVFNSLLNFFLKLKYNVLRNEYIFLEICFTVQMYYLCENIGINGFSSIHTDFMRSMFLINLLF